MNLLLALVLAGSAGGPPTAEPPTIQQAWGLAANAPAYEIAGGKAVVRMVHEGPNYMGLMEALPGVSVPEHAHSESTEMLYVLEGAGTMVVAGKRTTVKKGHMIQVPPGVKHSFLIPADAKGRFVAVQIYSPAGPEQRFKKGRRLK